MRMPKYYPKLFTMEEVNNIPEEEYYRDYGQFIYCRRLKALMCTMGCYCLTEDGYWQYQDEINTEPKDAT